MPSCCSPGSYAKIFGPKQAGRDARRYRKKGLDRTARLMVEQAAMEHATVLEVGGGVGAISLELLKRGASRATNIELSPAYDDQAWELVREAHVEEQVERRIDDFARAEVPPTDVVAMHRVVCCYPDYEELLGTASDHARHILVFSFPRETWWCRVAIRVMNAILRLRRCGFRAYVHPVAGLLAVPASHGLTLEFEQRGTDLAHGSVPALTRRGRSLYSGG